MKPKYKVGDKFKCPYGSVIEVKAIEFEPEIEWLAYECKGSNIDVSENLLDSCEKI